MKLIIHSVGTWEHPNLRIWTPPNDKVFALTLDVSIGAKNQKGTEYFSIRIATPAGLATLETDGIIIATRPLLVVKEYDYHRIWAWLEETVESCEADTWLMCVDNLKRYFNWEYDGYVEK